MNDKGKETTLAVEWECPECKNSFLKYIALYTRRQIRNGPPSVACFHCNKRFMTHSQRNSHYYNSVFAKKRSKRARDPSESESSESESSESESSESESSESESTPTESD